MLIDLDVALCVKFRANMTLIIFGTRIWRLASVLVLVFGDRARVQRQRLL